MKIIMTEPSLVYRSCSSYGTLVCNVVTPWKIYLFSDGRVNEKGKIISDDHSKVHKITKFAGMLAAGMYLKPLVPTLIKECEAQALTFVEDVVQIASVLLQKIWKDNLKSMEKREEEDKMKIFTFVAGYSKNKIPKLYYLESTSTPRFGIIERPLFKGGNDVEVGAVVSAGTTKDVTALISKHIMRIRETTKINNLEKVFRKAFDATKQEINAENQLVGGKTFFGIIDLINGFQLR